MDNEHALDNANKPRGKVAEKLHLKLDLQKVIDAPLDGNTITVVINNISRYLKFTEGEHKTIKLELLYNRLLTVKPSSMEANMFF